MSVPFDAAPSDALLQRITRHIEAICLYLMPDGRRVGTDWHWDTLPPDGGLSIRVSLSGPNRGTWTDACSGQSGNMLQLWQRLRQLDWDATVAQAAWYMGVSSTTLLPEEESDPPVELTDWLPPQQLPAPVHRYLTQERLLTQDTLERFGVGAYAAPESPDNWEIVFPYYRNNTLVALKLLALSRPNGIKQFRLLPNYDMTCMFGWPPLYAAAPDPAHTPLILTEGELDAMTLHQLGFHTLSIPRGALYGKQAWLHTASEMLALAPFQHLILCLDMDNTGKNAALGIAPYLGAHRCRIARLPYKDANDCLKAGLRRDDFQTLFDQAQTLEALRAVRVTSSLSA
jgi:twinkle protein